MKIEKESHRLAVALEKSRKKLSSRITNLKEGAKNTRYLHLRINARRPKNSVLGKCL
jgi:hypothetical protein